jgi:hypothetical protein
MNDRELLELAAKAAGLSVEFLSHANGLETVTALYPQPNNRIADGYLWNPLEDDGDALRLAVKLHIGLTFDTACDSVVAGLDLGQSVTAVHQLDDVGTRRAIVRVAAGIGRAMP